MARSRRGASERDARLRRIPDEDILEFLAAARRGLAAAAGREAAAYGASVASLELEASRRGLVPAGPHEPTPLPLVLARLRVLPPSANAGEWGRLLAELGLPGLWRVYLYGQNLLPLEERLPALARIGLAVDRIVYGEGPAHARWRKYMDLPPTDEARLAKVSAALQLTFEIVFNRLAGGEPAS